MKTIGLVIPFFGKIPDYFKVWKMSALNNKTVDFIFFTDIDEIVEENNIKVIHISFEEFVKKFQNKFSFDIVLDKPYKLCDYKPSYGYVLSEYLKGYDFWGHCDIDLIFGDIRNFITDAVLNNYDKILEYGHFTLYKNNSETNELFMKGFGYEDYDYKKAFTTFEAMYFDEFLGMQWIAKKNATPIYVDNDIFYDVLANEKPFRHITEKYKNNIFYFENGKLFVFEKENGEERFTEIMYAHFQKRTIDYSDFDNNKEQVFYIIPNRLVYKNNSDKINLFSVKGAKVYKLKRKFAHIKTYLKNYKKSYYGSFINYRRQRKKFRFQMIDAKKKLKEFK